jgi:hypothetical protein
MKIEPLRGTLLAGSRITFHFVPGVREKDGASGSDQA